MCRRPAGAPAGRGISTVVGYALTLTIVTLLVTGLLFAGGSFVEDQREETIRNELEVVGQQLAADVASADRLARAGDFGTRARLDRDLPDRVTGRSYTIELSDPASDPGLVTLSLRTENPPVTVTTRVWVRTDVADTTVRGGDIRLTFDGGDIEVTGR